MSLCYMFHKGRVILAGGGRVPERGEVPDCLAARFVNSGLVDRDGADDVWAELADECEIPAGFEACERRTCWTTAGASTSGRRSLNTFRRTRILQNGRSS